MPDLSILIISHGHENMISPCLASLAPALQNLSAEIILVDNLNRGQLPALTASAPIPPIFQNNPTPRGFATNVNQAAAAASGKYLLILNPDTRFHHGQFADAIAFLDRHPAIGLLGCGLVNEDGSPQRSFRRFPSIAVLLARGFAADRWPWRPRFYRERMLENQNISSPTPVDWVYGACMILRRDTFQSLAGMDERFRLYYEDVDLCYRIWQTGREVWYYPHLAIFHEHMRGSARRPFSRQWRWHVASAARYFLKHRNVFRTAPPRPIH